MRIEGSSVSMAAVSASVEKYTKEESLKMWTGNKRPDFEGNGPAAQQPQQPQLPGFISDLLDISEAGKAALQKQATLQTGPVEDDGSITYELSDKDKQKIYLIQKMLEALTGKKIKFAIPDRVKFQKSNKDASLQGLRSGVPERERQRQSWGLEYDLHEAHYEKQALSYAAEGTVKTSDGREIDFSVQLNMSREFVSRKDISIRAGDAKVDPLVINFGGAAPELTENKFSFDLDNNGTSDQISFVTSGSGFLALDLNGDGAVNNGSELFGPQSGNGFGELAAYDMDENGWIDENDTIYDRLRIWTKDENGNDTLFALGQKGIGALYLGNIDTPFDLKDDANEFQGEISKTGIFLRENGTAGTIQHINLAV